MNNDRALQTSVGEAVPEKERGDECEAFNVLLILTLKHRRFTMGDKGKKDKDKRGQHKQSKQDKKSKQK